eukprot:c19894_g1_i1.p1 GENE.c19894_g1_i1~~c19894_g1_i1.p1  ORF type:complete len:449 (-),score=127.11 c19894_g1_i1:37-1338(-)
MVAVVENQEERISQAKALAKTGNTAEALESLLALEKACRLNVDIDGTTNASAAIMEVCFESGDWKLLNDHVLILSKRRAQLKQAIAKVVQIGCDLLARVPSPFDLDSKIELIQTLRSVCAGKMYVEVEGARLTKQLSKIREDEGKVEEASDILQEIAPETCGTMEKIEKVNYILDQMRLALLRKDFIRAGLISNKINPKTISADTFARERVLYHRQMIQLFHHRKQYIEIARAYHALYSTEQLEDSATQLLRRVVAFVLLSPRTNEQADFLARVHSDRKLDYIPLHKRIVKLFTTIELITWPLGAEIGQELGATSDVWDGAYSDEIGETLRKRVVEHNIRVISGYYSRIRSARLASLLMLSEDETERHLSELVSSKVLYARIDRLEGRVDFKKPEEAKESLNAWAADITSLLKAVEATCHLVRKENVQHGIEA